MPTQPRIARILLSGATGSREWIATATTQDLAAGSTVDITVTLTISGATPPGEATTLELIMQNDSGGAIHTFTLTPGLASQSVTFHFTNDGTGSGTPRCGTVELNLRAVRTSLVAYDVQSDGTPNNAPTGFTSTLDRGWIRGTTTLIEAVSNIALGGAKNAPAAYDDSLFVRTTSGATSYVARALSVAVSNTTPALVQLTNSTTSTERDVAFASVCDDRFPVTVTTVGVSVTVPNATLTSQPDWIYTSTTDDSMPVDPRVTITHQLQLNDSAYGTPPSAKDEVPKVRNATDLGFSSFRCVNARGTGVNGLSVRELLQDASALSPPATDRTVTTSTQGGEAGWSPTFAAWDEALPGGNWNHTVEIQTTDADTLEVNGTEVFTLRAATGIAGLDPIDLALNGTISQR